MSTNQLVYASKIDKRLKLSYISKDNSKFIGRDKHNNYYKGYVKDLQTI